MSDKWDSAVCGALCSYKGRLAGWTIVSDECPQSCLDVHSSWMKEVPMKMYQSHHHFGEDIEDMYETLVPAGLADEDWGKMRIDTVKALLKGRDDILEKD